MNRRKFFSTLPFIPSLALSEARDPLVKDVKAIWVAYDEAELAELHRSLSNCKNNLKEAHPESFLTFYTEQVASLTERIEAGGRWQNIRV
jgi:hypothetical protein